MTRVLLVTGARSLADSPDAERWARALIAEALAGCDLLIVGDADGPDAWALRAAWDHSNAEGAFYVRRYITRGRHAGWVVTEAEMRHRPWTSDVPPQKGDPAEMTRAWYLLRNDAMVRSAQTLRNRGHAVEVLALLDGRKPAKPAPGEKRRTRGTEHTVGLARKAGLPVDPRTWPADGGA